MITWATLALAAWMKEMVTKELAAGTIMFLAALRVQESRPMPQHYAVPTPARGLGTHWISAQQWQQ